MSKELKLLTVKEYADTQAEALLKRFAWQVSHTAKSADRDSVHALRVNVRHLANCLRVFKQCYSDRARKKIRRQIQTIKKLAGEVRNRDIAFEVLMSKLKIQDEELAAQLTNEREQAERELVKALRRSMRHNLIRQWHEALEL